MQEETAITDPEWFTHRVCATQGLMSWALCLVPDGYRAAVHVHICTTRSAGRWSCVHVQNYRSGYMCLCINRHVPHKPVSEGACMSLLRFENIIAWVHASGVCRHVYLHAPIHTRVSLCTCVRMHTDFPLSALCWADSCFNDSCSWASALTAVAPLCFQDCFSPFRITSAQCSLNISPVLILKQRCNDFC